MRWRALPASVLVAVAVLGAAPAPAQEPDPAPAVIRQRGVRGGRYIVLLRGLVATSGDIGPREASIRAAATEIVGGNSRRVTWVYANSVDGFAARLSRSRAERVAADVRVEAVVPDGYAYAIQDADATCRRQGSPPSWGLDRIDERTLPLNAYFKYYWNGSGVNVYVIDTGIATTHEDFGGRAQNVHSADPRNPADCNGHGTHVAGIIGGGTYGVAKAVRLWGVKVFPGCRDSTLWSDVIAGIDWVVANHASPAVINMSLGGLANPAVDAAVQAAVRAGVTVVVAAGNETDNVDNHSPARVREAITVGASDRSDGVAGFSNFGAGVDLYAPGVGIVSSWVGSPSAHESLSGTSMAAPHVAGIAAAYLEVDPTARPSTVEAALLSVASGDVLHNLPAGSPNRLAYSRRQCPVACGDGFINQPGEQCEPPGSLCTNGQTCTASCTCPAPPPPPPPYRPECRVDLCNGSSDWSRDAYGNPDPGSCIAWAWAEASLQPWQKPSRVRWDGVLLQQSACDCCAKCRNRSGAYNMGVSQNCAQVASSWCNASSRGGLDPSNPDYNPGAFWGACPFPPN